MASIVSQVGGYFKHYFDLFFFLSRCSINTYVGSGGPRQNFASTKCEKWWRCRESNPGPNECTVKALARRKLHYTPKGWSRQSEDCRPRAERGPLAQPVPRLTCSRRLNAFFYFVPRYHRAKVGRGHARVGLVANLFPTSLGVSLALPCGLR